MRLLHGSALCAFVGTWLSAGAQSALDSLLRTLPSKQGAERVKTLGDVQWELGFSAPQKALAYGQEAMRLAEGLEDSAVIAQAANDFSITHYRLGHFQRSIDLNRRALAIRLALKDTLGAAASHNKIGAAFTEIMRLDSALVHNYAGERIYVAHGDTVRTAQMRGNISRLYQQLGNIPMALKVARETVAMLEPRDDLYAKANALGQLAMILTDAPDDAETERVALRALGLYEQLGSKADIGSISNILGMLARNKGDDASGLAYFRRALLMAEEVGDLPGQATFMLNIANVLRERGGTDEALVLYRRSIDLCAREGYLDPQMTALEGYVKTLEDKGRFAEALAEQKGLQALRDSVFRMDRLEAMSDMQVKYETERTEKELLAERQRTLEQQARLDRQRLLIGVVLASAMLAGLLAWSLIARQRARARAERDAAVIAEREQGLRNVVERADAERAHIAAELHDGVGQSLTGLKFRLEAMARENPELKDMLALADEAGGEVRGIAHRMMPRALGDLGLVPALADMLERSLKRPGMRYGFEHYGLEERLAPQVETGVYRIAQELVSNIIKHAGATQVQVQLLRNKGHLVLIVEDNGRGIDPASAGSGLGARGMQDRARVLHGTLEIAPGAERGTVATLRVPLSNGNTP
jgi:two-component system, NarL family, sensor kinase